MVRIRRIVTLAGRRSLAALATRSVDLPVEGDELPRAFRLFKAGENETTKGTFIFDDEAAKAVMARAGEHGVDLMVDLEHLSLDTESRNFDPDARAWLRLEVRSGELWAVDVRWTDDGARRLREKRQRYISPAFATDDENRVVEIVNIALTAMPATHGTPALVAAGRRSHMGIKERIAKLSARLSLAKGKIAKLADDGGEMDGPKGKGAQLKSDAEAAASAIEALQKAATGNDVDELFSAMEAAQSAIDALEKAMSAFGVQDSPGEAAPAPAATSTQAPAEQMAAAARRDAEIVSLRAELAKRKHDEEVTRLAAEHDERRALVGSLVRLGRETPATAWSDDTATTPRGYLATMPLAELRERVRLFGGTPAVQLGGGPKAPTHHVEMASGGSAMNEDEIVYLRARHATLVGEGQKLRPLDETILRYGRLKEKQLRGTQEKGDREAARRLSAPLDRGVVALAHRAGLITLASTPVTPFEEFGASSQIALQNFRLEYNLALASGRGGWAETIGRMLADGSMKTTYPLNFRALKYQERTATNAATGQPQNADIPVVQREFFEGQQVELRRLIKGDFAYVQSWAQLAGDLARARIFLRDELVGALLEGALAASNWGATATLTNGIDGQKFWSASHMVNPFDASMALRGSTTYSNYQASASPLSAATLTAEKNQSLQVAAPDGRELGVVFDGILYPSPLEQTVKNLLTVQDLILDAKASQSAIGGGSAVSNAFGQVRNPHFNSGMEMTRAQQLAGTDTTANYYLYSREAIARGIVPWVIAEDPTEEVRLFDESSDYYKNTGFIKYESHVFLNAALLYPHAIRYIKGS